MRRGFAGEWVDLRVRGHGGAFVYVS
jgi:hypothetical protein